MTDQIVGRESELGSIYGFLDGSAESPAGLVLEGEPGIGKSTLWLAAVASARERGFVVLVACPVQAERGLAHVGLGDLFDGVLDDVIGELSPPRRRALEVALLRDVVKGGDMRSLPFVMAAMSLMVSTAMAQDAVKVDPKHYSVVSENDQVRILKVHYGPHEKSVMHSHPNTVAVFLTDAKGTFTFPDGKSRTSQ